MENGDTFLDTLKKAHDHGAFDDTPEEYAAIYGLLSGTVAVQPRPGAHVPPRCKDGTFLSGYFERRDDNYGTALMMAVTHGNTIVTECILDNGADPKRCLDMGRYTGDEECHFPLLWACEKNNQEIVDLLLAHGADVTPTWPARNCAQSTYSCLHFAARNNNPFLVDVLLAHGAPVDQPTARNVSPLFIACQKGHAEVARKLLDAGADPHMARDDGATVLNTGSMCGFEEFAAGKNHT